MSFQSFIHNPPGSIILPLSKIPKTPPLHAYPFTQEGHHAAHEDNGDHSQSEVQEEGPRGGQGVHPVKNGAIFGKPGVADGPKRHHGKQLNVRARKLNMELKTWKCGR